MALLDGRLESQDVDAVETVVEGALYVEKKVRQSNAFFPYHVVLTERARLDLIRQYNVEASRVVVIHHSMDVTKYGRDVVEGTTFRKRWNVSESHATVFGFASMLHKTKGLEMLIDTAPLIVSSGLVRCNATVLYVCCTHISQSQYWFSLRFCRMFGFL
jgi:hypothetical protein